MFKTSARSMYKLHASLVQPLCSERFVAFRASTDLEEPKLECGWRATEKPQLGYLLRQDESQEF
jgi:hypothetical protein